MKNGGDTYRMGHIIRNDWGRQGKMDGGMKEYEVWSRCKNKDFKPHLYFLPIWEEPFNNCYWSLPLFGEG